MKVFRLQYQFFSSFLIESIVTVLHLDFLFYIVRTLDPDFSSLSSWIAHIAWNTHTNDIASSLTILKQLDAYNTIKFDTDKIQDMSIRFDPYQDWWWWWVRDKLKYHINACCPHMIEIGNSFFHVLGHDETRFLSFKLFFVIL